MRARNNSYMTLVLGVVIIVTLLVGAVIGGAVGYTMARSLSPIQVAVQSTAGIMPIPMAETNPEPAAITDQSSSVGAVKKVLPAVVTVVNQGQRGMGSGSGFFISTDGYVVTNNHVVEDAQELLIIYAQGGRAPARLIGAAPDFDLAVIKIDGPVPAVAAWGDSGELPLGAQVVAIGSALGKYQNTVTMGVLSGFDRELTPLRGLLQTDAAINSGNSGGPLINLAGQVVGINTAVVRGESFSTEAEGLGFAIPSNVARVVVQRLIESGEARPSYLGVEYQELNPQLVIEQNLTISQGALLQQIAGGSPAEQAGLQTGDIIIAVNDRQIDDRHPLVSLLIEHIAGETVTLDILRNGETFQTELTLGERI